MISMWIEIVKWRSKKFALRLRPFSESGSNQRTKTFLNWKIGQNEWIRNDFYSNWNGQVKVCTSIRVYKSTNEAEDANCGLLLNHVQIDILKFFQNTYKKQHLAVISATINQYFNSNRIYKSTSEAEGADCGHFLNQVQIDISKYFK